MQANIEQMVRFSLGIFVFLLFSFPVGAQSDREIEIAADKVIQYPNNSKKKEHLMDLFMRANQADLGKIRDLRSSGNPAAWYDIYQSYQALENRQKILMQLPGPLLSELGVVMVDYEENKEEARLKAARYLYAHAEKLLEEKNPVNASVAYFDALKILKLYDSFRDVDVLIRKAVAHGAGSVDYDLINNSGSRLDPVIFNEMGTIFTEFQNKLPGGISTESKTDFSIQVIVTDVDITAGQVKELKYGEERDLLDENGNPVDTIRCVVNETRQRKSASIKTEILYRDNRGDVVINRVPVNVESVFLHRFGSMQGDPDAASAETLELIRSREVQYPSDSKLLKDAMELYRGKAMKVMLPE